MENPLRESIDVKNPFSGNINTRLRMYKVFLFKFRCICAKGLQKMIVCENNVTQAWDLEKI